LNSVIELLPANAKSAVIWANMAPPDGPGKAGLNGWLPEFKSTVPASGLEKENKGAALVPPTDMSEAIATAAQKADAFRTNGILDIAKASKRLTPQPMRECHTLDGSTDYDHSQLPRPWNPLPQ
jgi:hypothetical protein